MPIILSSLKKVVTAIILVTLVVTGLHIPNPQTSWALSAPTVNVPTAKISFTFDDALSSAYVYAAPILQKYGFTGTEFAPTGCINDLTATSQCALNEGNASNSYLTLTQLKALHDTYGWEIGDHTINHPLLTTLSAADSQQELDGSKQILQTDGLNPVSMATPYGDYDPTVVSQIAKDFQAHRGFADVGYNVFPYNDYLLYDQQVQGGVSVTKVKSYIQTALKNKRWLILTFHDILPNASTDPSEYQYSTANLDAIAAYIKSVNIPVVNIQDGLATSSNNLVPDASFNDGIADGWQTDDPSHIFLNTQGMGNYPDPTNSIELTGTGTTKNGHLFSPKISVDPSQKYVLKTYLNLQQNTNSGAVGFYVDEYDAAGNWISGQFKVEEGSAAFVESMNFEYKPTSSLVKQASLQIIVTANSGIKAYVDNVQWFPEIPSQSTPTPTVTQTPSPTPTVTATPTITPSPTPTSTPTPTPTSINLMPNGDFDNGISNGWRTDSPTTITADNSGHGSGLTPATSVKFVATTSTANTHLFSPLIGVSNTHTYSISSNLNMVSITSGVFAYYIDEYDINGNWISGQYITDRNITMNGSVSFTYTPSSASVGKASLQFILVGNSGITAYIDAVNWTQH